MQKVMANAYQEERGVEVKVDVNNVLEYSYILFLARYLIIFSIDIWNHITYNVGYPGLGKSLEQGGS
jgi:hypothetical protein